MEDIKILQLFLNRDPGAIEEAEKKYGSYCLHIALNILQNREDAEEAVSDTWLGAWSSIPPHKPAALATYLGKITRRSALKILERSRACKRGSGELCLALEELSEVIPDRNTPDAALEKAELTRILNRFLAALPQTERVVFIRRYWHLDSIDTIAANLGFSRSKVKSMLLRTRKKLRNTLIKEEIPL